MGEVCDWEFDVHAYTSKVITDAGQPTTRQDAKAHTFAPLYGATGFGRRLKQKQYYSHFTEVPRNQIMAHQIG